MDWNDGAGSLSELNVNYSGINFNVATPSTSLRWYFNPDGSTVFPGTVSGDGGLLSNIQTTGNTLSNIQASAVTQPFANLVVGPSPSSVLANLHVERGDVFIGNSAATGTVSNSGATSVSRLIFDNSHRNTIVPNKIVLYSNTASGNVCGLSVLTSVQTDVPYLVYQGGVHYFVTKSTSSLSGYQAMILSADGQLNLAGSSSRAHLDIANGNMPSSNIQVQIDSSNLALVVNGSGRVGLGTLTPGATLDVRGNIYASNSLTATNVSATTANIGTLNVATISNLSSLNVSSISNLNSITTPTANVGTLNTSGLSLTTLNVLSISNLNSISTPLANVTTLNTSGLSLTTLNVSSISNLNSLILTNNLVASNAVTTTNVLASTETLTGTSGQTTLNVTGNIYASNALVTTNIVAAGFTSNTNNTVFNFDTLTIPFINSTTLNVAATSNLQVATLTGSTGTPTVYVSGNIYASNALSTTNVTATLMNTTTLNVTTAVGTFYGPYLGSNVASFLNVYSTNAVTTTNVFASSVVPTYPISFRNRIINGDFIIDQRNAGANTTPSAGVTRVIDRWKVEISGSGRCIVGQNLLAVASPAGFTSYYGMQVSTTSTVNAGDYFFLSQVIEGINVVDLAWGTASAKPVTLSFWAYSSITGTGGGFIRNAGESAGNYNRSYPFTYTINGANTWEYKTVAITGDTTGQWFSGQYDGVEVGFIMWNGSTWQGAPGVWGAANYTGPSGGTIGYAASLNSRLFITGVQFEAGPNASQFERRHIGFELAQCQRYYEPSIARMGGYHTTGGYLRSSVYFNVKKRPKVSPTFTVVSTPESSNFGALGFDSSNFDQSSARILASVTTTGDAYGQWKVAVDCEF